MKCFLWAGKDGFDRNYLFAFCGNNPHLVFHNSGGGKTYYQVWDNGVNVFPNFWQHSSSITEVTSASAYTSSFENVSVFYKQGSCVSCLPSSNNKYDCINGNCTQSTTYNTPGIYNSLEECQANCGSSNPGNQCDGVCISSPEWATIQGLASQLKNKSCG